MAMKKYMLIVASVLLTSQMASAQVTQADFEALKVIFDQLGGKNWTNKSGWDFAGGASSVKKYNAATGEGWWGINDVSKERVAKLELIENNLTGELPDAIYALDGARTINLSKNNISGRLGAGIGKLSKITSFDLSNNQLEGELPAEFLQMGRDGFSRIQTEGKSGTDIKINLHNNQFSGTLPADLGNMTLLNKPSRSVQLNFSNNQFTGELPASILNITMLTSLRASNNQLTGTVPAGLDEMENLKVIRLEKNKFTGPVPQKK